MNFLEVIKTGKPFRKAGTEGRFEPLKKFDHFMGSYDEFLAQDWEVIEEDEEPESFTVKDIWDAYHALYKDEDDGHLVLQLSGIIGEMRTQLAIMDEDSIDL